MSTLAIKKVIADQGILCSFCENLIEPGEIFWQLSGGSNHEVLPVCKREIPLNTTNMIQESSTNGSLITCVRPDAIDVRRDMIPTLLSDWDAVHNLTPEEFEELVFDRLIAMDLQPFRMGPANRKDGGIDIIFWTNGLLPMLGAVQVKHHRSPKAKTGPAAVSELAAAMQGHHFNVGLIVTNTSFTSDAKHRGEKASSLIQLRDGEALRKWIADDFAIERVNAVTRTIEFCKGIKIRVPQFL